MENIKRDLDSLVDAIFDSKTSDIIKSYTEWKMLKKENELLKEELKELKDGIIGIYNNMNSLEIINKHELESDIEEL